MEDNIYMFAKNVETGEIFEVTTMELYQGYVLYLEILDKNGLMQQIDEPTGLEYILQQETKEVENDK